MTQRGIGIHTRQYARAFIIEDASGNRAVFVNADISAFSHAMKRDVISCFTVLNCSFRMSFCRLLDYSEEALAIYTQQTM